MSFEIKKIDPQAISEPTLQALLVHTNIMRSERLPDDPPEKIENLRTILQNIPPVVRYHLWLVHPVGETEVVARAVLVMVQREDNQHLGQMELEVRPAYRRQGIGRSLLAAVTETAENANRTKLLALTSGRVPAGDHFMARIGAQKGLETHINQLNIESLDEALVETWLARGQARSAGFELVYLNGPYTDEDLPHVVRLMEAMNSQPTGDLDVQDSRWTPEQIRQVEQMVLAGGKQRWTYFVREEASGNYAGYTQVAWNPSKPQYLQQGDTVVLPEYRGNGFGRWLKAAMLRKVIDEKEAVRFVRTGNADGNAPMLKINRELGFTPYQSETVWQVAIMTVRDYLQGN